MRIQSTIAFAVSVLLLLLLALVVQAQTADENRLRNLAASDHNLAAVRELLRKGVNPNVRTTGGDGGSPRGGRWSVGDTGCAAAGERRSGCAGPGRQHAAAPCGGRVFGSVGREGVGCGHAGVAEASCGSETGEP